VAVPISAPIADRLLGLLGRSAMAASSGTTAAVARAETAETYQLGGDSIRLLLDADATAGAISAHRVCLTDGALGANPHRHMLSSEAFYILDGSADLLVGEERTCAQSGDLVVVPPGEVHAFAASRGATAEVLVFITPGVKRFELFRRIARIRAGQGDDGELSTMQSDVDTYAVDSPKWSYAR
jgi:quercetin dioxygenase-like cupin family protein